MEALAALALTLFLAALAAALFVAGNRHKRW